MAMETPVEKEAVEEVDLNETARKHGLMTDEKFQSILEGVTRMEEEAARMDEGPDLASEAISVKYPAETLREPEEAARMAEGPDLASEVVSVTSPTGTFKESEEETAEPERKAESEGKVERESNISPVQTETEVVAPGKPKAAKRKLVLKDDLKTEEKKPRRVSQRCLGRGTTGKAGANTTSNAVEISSEEEEGIHETEEGPETKSPSHVGQEERAPAEAEENPTVTPPKPVDGVIVEDQTAQPTDQDEPPTLTEESKKAKRMKTDTNWKRRGNERPQSRRNPTTRSPGH